ncbi:cytosolic sulfotransferase 12-like [Andrographis paniculata]|uniref:cytosolic sulfotransferase 12-like n=1 Tax=Andrographis paniculata TaxID=175694 RepID=UPI0021E82955|nr:cytosolic sulfotransferase 12-like [Andrographis paniculata]
MTSDESFSRMQKYLNVEDTLSQEFKTFLSTLPKIKGSFGPYGYLYEGFWYFPMILRGIVAFRRHFHPQSSDIFLITYPKSGTTWLKSLVFTIINRHRFPIEANHPLNTTNAHQLIPFLETHIYHKEENPNLDHLPFPRVFSTHIPWTTLPESIRNSSTCKIVYLCRNPKDIIVSLWHFQNKLMHDETKEMATNSILETFENFCQGVNDYGPFWRHMLDYWKQSKENPDKIYFLKYEDMKEQPSMHLRRLAKFLDCPFSSDEEESGLLEDIMKLCSFENLSNLEINKNGVLSYSGMQSSVFFRQGKTGDWKNHLSDEMVQKLINVICEDKLSGLGFN